MITLSVTPEEIDRCYAFAKKIIEGGNQFNRFNQNTSTQINRTYIGKLAEYVFLHYLHSQMIEYAEGDMFEVFEGQENADTCDFLLPNGQSIDIKTASLPFHSRIMAPMSQFHLKKDFYVGIKLNFATEKDEIIPSKISSCILYGYADRAYMEARPVQNFGEGDCKAVSLNKLLPIERLIKGYKA
jgi:hypothetical protein